MAGRNYNDFICLTYGTGIGGAIVIGKEIYRGADGIAGEFGHMVTHANGKPCVCGKRGCYEMYGSTRALTENVRKATGKQMDGREIFMYFNQPKIREIIDSWIDEVVWGLVSLSHIFNPPCFILGGGILNETYVFDQIRLKLKRNVIPSFKNSIVKPAQKGNNAGIYGAYWNARQLLNPGSDM
ncbi:MAG: ROK family protein [Caldicoprobacterales bacterium]